MYHQPGFMGEAGGFGGSSQTFLNYPDLLLMGSSSSTPEEKLRLPNYFSHGDLATSLNLSSAAIDFGALDPMQASSYHQLFDPAATPPLFLRMLSATSGNFQPLPEGFGHEIPAADSVSPAGSTIFYDPNVELDVANKASLVREMFHNSLQGNGAGLDDGYYCGGQVERPGALQLDSRRKNSGKGKGWELDQGVGSQKNEKQRRVRLTRKYDVLKALIPNSTKPDRATIIADTIDYIKELLRTADELKILVEKKRRRKERSMKLETTDEEAVAAGDMEISSMKPLHESKVSLRSSWLRRKSKDVVVDVRIVEDEVYIKLTQHRRIDSLLTVSRVLDELQLELLHLSAGIIGNLHIFMINTKIHEGSSVYAGAIVKRLMEAMDVQVPSLVC